MNKLTLSDIITNSARKALCLQNVDGSMPAGHNGPYNDEETPVRNTGHWLMLFKKAFDTTGEVKFSDAVNKCLHYLMSTEARPGKATFWHRKSFNKDQTNGLVGQAWSIEALLHAYDLTGNEEILTVAQYVFCLHPYDQKGKGWKVVNIDGTVRGFDYTYNHQLWFAAIGTDLLCRLKKEDLNGLKDFIEAIPTKIQVYRDGVIKHILPFYLRKSKFEILRALGSKLKLALKGGDYVYSKSVGYHGFNLYALALIHQNCPQLLLLTSEKIRRALKVTSCDSFKNRLLSSKYGYPYNPAGIEFSYAFDVIGDDLQRSFWISEQIKRTYDLSQHEMSKGKTFDHNTANARLYEAVRLRDCMIKTI